MRPGRASRSAMGSALLRAAHVLEDPQPWIFEDTLSARLLTAGEAREPRATIASWPPEVYRALRVAHATRSRLAEDMAVEGLAAGRRDYVLLGAGLDTFAWRHPRAGEFTVWEIDHPDTQAWKRSALARAGLADKPNDLFVPVDLATTPLGRVPTPPLATWNWLGVTMYLERSATEAVLRAIASHQVGTTVIVNFLLDSGPDELTRSVHTAAAAAVAAGNEPIVAPYKPEDIESLLQEAGFSTVELLDGDALRARYTGSRSDLRHPQSTLIAVATV